LNQKDSNKKVLIAPLDWGLGHTTRCIPIISDLLKNNIEVIFCGEEPSATIIKNEFPTIEVLY
jgi:spore coat polysaccharide biosynthesis predicted glycosyltransferase SpsG